MRDKSVFTETMIERFAKDKGVFRLREAVSQGVHPEQVRRLLQKGILERVARGTYRHAHAVVTEHQTMAEACARIPTATLCLLSALRFHELTVQAPFEVWMAIAPSAHKAAVKQLPVRFVRFSGSALTEGIEQHQTASGSIRVYSVAKTVADCFKYRNKIGTDVAIEALREGRHEKRFGMDELWHYAKICRVSNVMRPYLEML